MTQPGSGGVRVRVDGPAATLTGYDVVVRHGAIGELAPRVAAAAPAAAYAIVTPRALRDTYGAQALAGLRSADFRAELLTFDDRETRKTRDTWASITDRMIELKFGRDACIVALGGGVTGDVAGFVAATYMRGIPFVQVPTTLLAMIDAAVGGKTGVDTPLGKNLVGSFHSPVLVLVDPAALHTLPEIQLRSGLAEAVKHGAILDAGYFNWIGEHADALLSLDAAALEHLVARSITLKSQVVSSDPLERGRRAILNFGHTVGHALERFAGYTMPHGFAVSVGMCVEAAVGEAIGTTRAGTADECTALLSGLGLPVRATFSPDALLDAMSVDKKARSATPHFVLLHDIGECAAGPHDSWTHAVPPDTLLHVLHQTAGTPDLV